jgi:hypothetical protein
MHVLLLTISFESSFSLFAIVTVIDHAVVLCDLYLREDISTSFPGRRRAQGKIRLDRYVISLARYMNRLSDRFQGLVFVIIR